MQFNIRRCFVAITGVAAPLAFIRTDYYLVAISLAIYLPILALFARRYHVEPVLRIYVSVILGEAVFLPLGSSFAPVNLRATAGFLVGLIWSIFWVLHYYRELKRSRELGVDFIVPEPRAARLFIGCLTPVLILAALLALLAFLLPAVGRTRGIGRDEEHRDAPKQSVAIAACSQPGNVCRPS